MSEHLLTVCEALGSISPTPQKRGGGGGEKGQRGGKKGKEVARRKEGRNGGKREEGRKLKVGRRKET